MSDDELANNPDYEYDSFRKAYRRKLFLLEAFPSRESLEASVGCPLPDVYVNLVRRAFEGAQGDPSRFMKYYIDIVSFGFDADVLRVTTRGWDLSRSGRYSSTPVELFPVESMFVDGVHAGFVVLAPERDQADFPFASHSPMGSNGTWIRGRIVEEWYDLCVTEYLQSHALYDRDDAFFRKFWKKRLAQKRKIPEHLRTQDDKGDIVDGERFLASSAKRLLSEEVGQLLTTILEVIGAKDTWQSRLDRLSCSKKKVGRTNLETKPIPAVAKIPKGYSYLPCHDHIGTLAPTKSFRSPIKAHPLVESRNQVECLKLGKEALAAGFPGSALHFLRCGWEYALLDPDEEYAEVAAKVYRALNRELLAKVVELMYQEAVQLRERMTMREHVAKKANRHNQK